MKSALIGIVQREKHPKVTPGRLILPWNSPQLHTLELPWVNNEKGKSCIPAGIYTLVPFNSPKHKMWVWKFLNTSPREDIEMHVANYACDCVVNTVQKHSELLGCIAPGFGFNPDIPMLTESRNAMQYLKTTIGEQTTWQLDIRDAKL